MDEEQNREQPDVAAILEAIREEVRRRRATQRVPGGSASAGSPAFPEIELRRMLQEVEAGRAVSAHWPIHGRTLPQRAIAFLNRLVRRYLRWYINPIVEQQNAYNDVIARALHGLVAANEELRAEVALLRERLQEQPGGAASEGGPADQRDGARP
jgi:hypothetical protein